MEKAIPIAAAVGLVWYLFGSLEQKTLYFPHKQLDQHPGQVGLSFEEVAVTTQDGVKVHGWWIPGNRKVTILLSHGNAGNISHRLDKATRLRASGANILLFDYRGYGKSQGKPSEKGTYQDADAFFDYLTQTSRIPASEIVFYGESLGAAVALEMAVRHGGAGVILEAPFTSTIDIGRRVYPWLPVKWIVKYKYDNLSKIPRLKAPLLILHSRADEIVPFQMGEELYAAAPEPKRLVELTGGHNEGYEESGDTYINAVKDFLNARH